MLEVTKASAVLEGTISITDTAKEGPFGEMHGYSFLDENSQQPLYKVKAITHRNNAILPVCVPGRANLGPDETHTMIGTLASAEIRHLLQQHGLPVTQVFALFETQVIWAAVQVDRKKLAEMGINAKDFCTKIGDLVFRNKCGMQIHRLLVVGEDINPFDMNDVTWAFATRCRPAMDEFHFEDVPAYPLVPYMSHGPGTKLTGGKVVANCLLPEEYEGKQSWVTCDFENGYPDNVKKRVLSRCSELGMV
ncbi:ferulic acid decarboxylase 1 [Fusarium sp. NRRL 52700]|nr:ferulic acid decarboxylase 1 [Fusarium sp. NRRL 52700]